MQVDRRMLVAGTVAIVGIGGLALAMTRPVSRPMSEAVPGAGRATATETATQTVTGTATATATETATATATATETATAVANELGRVPVLEYHGIGAREARWVRTAQNFRRDLAWLHAHGYVSATVLDMLAGFPDVPAGKKPAVLTFDDARGDQFVATGMDEAGLAIVAPDSGVGIMMRFAADHPGFGHRASFYLLPVFFEDAGTAGAKLRFLAQNGFEIGNHTWSHLMLGKAQPARIRDELARLQGAVREHLGPGAKSFRTRTVALPNGSVPRTPAQLAAAIGGVDQEIHHEALLLVGANPALSPHDKAFNPLRIARIQAVDDEWRRWFGRKTAHDMGGKETFEPYISDGDPTRVSPRVGVVATGTRSVAADVAVADSTGAATARSTATVPGSAAVSPATIGSETSTATAMETATVSAGSRIHPGYREELPPGGLYADGRIVHTVQQGQSFDKLLWRYLKFTDAYTPHELRDQIMRHNDMANPWVKPGQVLEIPGARALPPRPRPRGVRRTFEAKGIYCTSTTAGFERIFNLARALKAVGGNTVVFDVKDRHIAYESQDPMVRSFSEWDHTVKDLPKLVDRLHQMGIHVVARVVLFNDPVLARKRPDLAIKSKKTGKVWLQRGKPLWVDPSQPEVVEYNIRMATELARNGIDEIQFDYVRFPAEGDTTDCKFNFDETQTAKHEVITAFMRRAREALEPYRVLLSIDVYGVMAWQKDVDLRVTGQKLGDMARYVDAISPMVYPSHFYGPFDGYLRPANEPYYFVSQGVERVRRMVGPDGPVIRPWLQAFPYKVASYSPPYVAKQLQAARDGKGVGWLLWNASNKYDIAYSGVANWNLSAPAKPVVAVKVKGDKEPPLTRPAAQEGATAGATMSHLVR